MQNLATFIPEIQEKSKVVHSAAQLKGRRLRMARALSGLSRQDFFVKFSIATSTIDTWESGRVDLTEKGALRVCRALQQINIYCTPNWLLTGAGSPPKHMNDIEKAMLDDANNTALQISDESAIQREANFFLQLHSDGVTTTIIDDSMAPTFQKGDMLGGKIRTTQSLVGKIGIFKLSENITVVGYLKSSGTGTYNISFNKAQGLINVKIINAAEIAWHRKNI